MNDRLLDPNRLVYVRRTLRYPENKITYESMPYWLALVISSNAFYEDNTKSLRIMEIDDI